MAGWASFSMAEEILNFYYLGVPIDIESSLYIRLLVSPSSRSGGGTETNYGGYSRFEWVRTAGLWTVDSSGRLTNNSVLSIGSQVSSLGNGDLVAFDIVDTPSGAFTKIYNGGPINPARALVIGKPVKFKAGSLIITF